MYKRFTIDDLTKINTSFFPNLKKMYTRRKYMSFKAFLTNEMKESPRQYYLESGKPAFRIHYTDTEKGQIYRLVDEKDKIEVLATETDITQIHNFLKNANNVKKISKDHKTILETLFDELLSGELMYIQDKPFLTYDIETTFTGNSISGQHFEMAYSVESNRLKNDKLVRQYVDRTSMQRYCDYLLQYDGRIIGYNQIGFDNPVMIHNCGYGQAELDILNKKSIDPFLFFHRTLKRRIGLSKVAGSLISQGKDLFDSGADGSKALVEYKKNGDKKLLNMVKKYCKNDVRITLGVFLYLMSYQKIHIENASHEFTVDEMVARSLETYGDQKIFSKKQREAKQGGFGF